MAMSVFRGSKSLIVSFDYMLDRDATLIFVSYILYGVR